MEGSSTINLEFNYIEALCTKAGMNYLECLWLSESHFQEAWLGLCSVITRGKNLCSTTKSQKRRANANYFCGISGVNFDSPRIRERIGNGTHATKLLKLAKGLSEQSDRWRSIAVDEILSVVSLIDTDCDGSVQWSEFHSFCNRVENVLSTQEGKNTPQKAFAQLYITLIAEKQTRITKNFINTIKNTSCDLTEGQLNGMTAQLIKQAIYARLNGMNPLTLLVNLRVHERMVLHKRKINDNTNNDNGSGDESETASTTASVSGGSPYIPIEALISLFTHLGANINGTDTEDVLVAKENFQKQLLQSSIINDPNAVGADTANNENLNNISRIDPMDSSMLTTPDATQKENSKSNSNSTNAANEDDESNSNINDSISQLRLNATAISAKLASQGQDVDAAMNIWSALQTLETELTKATSANTSPRTPHANRQQQYNNNMSPMTPLTPQSPRGMSPTTLNVNTTFSSTSVSAACTTTMTMNGNGRVSPVTLFDTPGSNVKRTLSSNVLTDDDHISTTAEMHASMVLNSTSDNNRSASISPLSQFSTTRANMSIFRSPRSRSSPVGQVTIKTNTYCDETMSWECDKSNLTNIYNQRFQTANQVKDASKIFKVLGVGAGCATGGKNGRE